MHSRALHTLLVRVLVLASAVLGLDYLAWRALFSVNWDSWFIAVPLLFAEMSSFVDTALFGITMWRQRVRSGRPPTPVGVTVDVLITRLNEPVELLRHTVRHARAIQYPHRTWVLDDGASAEVERMAAEEGAGYLVRGREWKDKPRHAKAGNLNNALFETTGEFLLVLDADQLPDPRILHHTLGYFADPDVALVQTPQHFYNVPRGDPLGNQALLFYGPIQQGKDGWNAAFFCGSNAVLRREALMRLGIVGYAREVREAVDRVLRASGRMLRGARRRAKALGDPALLEAVDAVDAAARRARLGPLPVEPDIEGGIVIDDRRLERLARRDWSPLAAVESIAALVRALDVDRAEEAQPVMPMATISITEDMATAMRLHAQGWRSVYHDEILAQGLAPEDLETALKQRLRWARGTLQVLLRENPLTVRGLSLGQRLMYFATMWSYLQGVACVVYLAAPVIYLVLGISPLRAFSGDFYGRLLPYLIPSWLLLLLVGWRRSAWRGHQYSLALFPIWIRATIGAVGDVVLGRRLRFVVTAKVRRQGRRWHLVVPQLVALALLCVAVVMGLGRLALGRAAEPLGVITVLVWATYDLAVLGVLVEALSYEGPGPVSVPTMDGRPAPVPPGSRGWLRRLRSRLSGSERRPI